jgi:hypothetical protein
MSKKMGVGTPDAATAGDDRLKLFDPPGGAQSTQPLVDRNPKNSLGSRPNPASAPLMYSEERRVPIVGPATPKLRSNCPICGKTYQTGEGVVALASIVFSSSALPSQPTPGSDERGGMIPLGHHACVLPRLLTLLAGFQPEVRFVEALRDFAMVESELPERPHGRR